MVHWVNTLVEYADLVKRYIQADLKSWYFWQLTICKVTLTIGCKFTAVGQLFTLKFVFKSIFRTYRSDLYCAMNAAIAL